MPRIERFTFVVNEEEREMISLIAKELHRSDSDAVRFLIISKAKEIEGKYSADYLTDKDIPDVCSS